MQIPTQTIKWTRTIYDNKDTTEGTIILHLYTMGHKRLNTVNNSNNNDKHSAICYKDRMAAA